MDSNACVEEWVCIECQGIVLSVLRVSRWLCALLWVCTGGVEVDVCIAMGVR